MGAAECLSAASRAADREAIRQLTARFLRAVDAKRWQTCRELLCRDAELELGLRAPSPGADAWIAAVSRAFADAVTVHHAHMPEVAVGGADRARSTGALMTYVERPAAGARDGHREHGHYAAEHRRERGAWRIAAFRTSALRRDPLGGERPPDIEALRLRGGEAAPPGVPLAPAALVELEAIAQLKARYFRFLDGRRWGDWRRLFADDARFELEGVGGDVSTPDRFVATVRATLRRTVTVHHGHMPELELLDQRHARGTWALADYVDWFPGSQGIRGFGNYEEEYVKAGTDWRIAALRLSYLRLDGFSREPWTPPRLRRLTPDWLAAGTAADAGRLDDLDEIRELKARYFRLMDAKRWTDMRDLFSADARFSTPRMGRGSERLDVFMAALERQLDGVVTVHHGHMPEIVFSGADEARGIWALHDQLEWPAGGPIRRYSGYGHYEERYRREDGVWRIAALRLSRLREDIASR